MDDEHMSPYVWCTPNLLKRFKCESNMKITEKYEIGACSLARKTLGV